MSKHNKILLCGAMLALSVSVAFAAEKSTKSSTVDWQHDDGLTVSDVAFVNTPTFCLTSVDHDMLAGEYLVFEPVKEGYIEHYDGLKLNNKALPLAKKIWLINCQIALK